LDCSTRQFDLHGQASCYLPELKCATAMIVGADRSDK
jgi:hypothetical protein